MRWFPLSPVRRRRAGRRPKRRMAPCRNGIQTVAAWISKISRNHEPMPGWAGTETGRPGKGRHIRPKARQHMHGMQCHVCLKRWGGSIRGCLIRRREREARARRAKEKKMDFLPICYSMLFIIIICRYELYEVALFLPLVYQIGYRIGKGDLLKKINILEVIILLFITLIFIFLIKFYIS